ncbi:MAG: hypothetical protein KTR31_09680 [Myxococcales bacterium]|nr:hypothetical protein [Myxococcales bacterium]
MRNLSFTIAITLLGACASSAVQPDATLQYRSTFDGRTNGLVLHQSGDEGHAGMFGSNCPFDTHTGNVTGDYDLPGEDEDVQDAEETTLGEITLVATVPDTVHVLDKTGGTYTHVPLALTGVVEGRLTRDGVVGLTEACDVHWLGLNGDSRAHVTLDACGGELETDPATGITVVGDAVHTVVTDGEWVVTADRHGDLVAFDPGAQAFYVATVGQARVSALELDGSERWSVHTPGPVTALDDAGDTAAVAIVMALPDGNGAVALHDGVTGEQRHLATTPSAAEDLSVSGNGSVLALVRPEQAFFYVLAP